MKTACLIRVDSSDEGTFGHLIVDDFHCRTGEPPWRDNKPKASCIPPGVYLCKISDPPSPKYGKVYKIQNVPGRSGVLIHAGNYCGDEDLPINPYKTDTDGCVLPGEDVQPLLIKQTDKYQKAVTASRATLEKFMAYMEKEPFELRIFSPENVVTP